MSASLQLQAFVDSHPPHPGNTPAGPALIERYEALLPGALLELWRTHGLGYYGERRLWLLDPEAWQPALDRWLIPSEDGVRRIPVLMTPFGTLLYYRKLTDDDEDISALDIHERDVNVLNWNFLECLNQDFTDSEWLDDLVPDEALDHARKTSGALEAGEVYQLDQVLRDILSRYDRVDAHVMFQEVFESMQACANFDYPSPGTVEQALPAAFRDEILALKPVFAQAPNDAVTGLYLSAQACRYQLLTLRPDDQCVLICWTTHPQDLKTRPPQLFRGHYRQQLSAEGDTLVILDLDTDQDRQRDIAPDQMFYFVGGDHPMLIREEDLTDVADSLDWNETVDNRDPTLRKVGFDYFIPKDEVELPTPARAQLPTAIHALLRDQPLKVVITHIEEPDEELGEIIVQARIETNTGRLPSMNMPMCSPAASEKELLGWVWDASETTVRIGLTMTPDGKTGEQYWPTLGDVLVSRSHVLKEGARSPIPYS